MQSYTNFKRVKRMSLLSKVLLFGGLGIMGLALLLNFQNPEQYFQLVILMAIIGILMFQIGMPMQNRWNREPRMDQILDEATKGLDQRYSFLHYLLGVDHALITPSGVFAVVPRIDNGMISSNPGGELLLEKTKPGLFRRGSKPKPLKIEAELWREADRLNRSMQRELEGVENVSCQPYLVFVHPETTVRAEGPDYPISHLKKLKADLRKLPKAATLGRATVEQLVEAKLH